MTKRALVDYPESNRVYQIVEVGSDFPVASPLYFTDCGDTDTVNHEYNGSVFTLPTSYYDALRAGKLAELLAYEDSIRDTGATWPSPTGNDKPYRIRMDLGDIQNYTALLSDAISAATATDAAHTTFFSTYEDPGMTIFSTDTSTVPTLDTKEKALDFCKVMLKAHRDVAAVSYSKQAAIAALPDNEATIAAYDVTTGWPVI